MLEIAPTRALFLRPDAEPADWVIAPAPVAYPDAVAAMEARVASIINGNVPEAVWLLQHPPLYTGGTSAKAVDLLDKRFPVYESGRGGQYTYHGPGQRIAYVMLDLKARKPDVRAFVQALEDWIIDTLWDFHVRGEKRCDRVGVWIKRPTISATREDKIAAIGIRLRKWVSLHGIALNIEPDLTHYDGIVPCGVTQHGVTSLTDLGLTATMEDVDIALRRNFEKIFGKTKTANSL
ncbi:MAG: lipoyl(octanoyl) transferase LipB [Pseudomonadota bacterium]